MGAGPRPGVPARPGRGPARQQDLRGRSSGRTAWDRGRSRRLQVAIDKRVRDEAFHVIPVLLPGAERPRRGDVAHLEFLINASWVEFLTTLDDERAFRSLVWGITGTKPPAAGGDKRYEGRCPYRGLEAFGPTTRSSSSAART